jgi:inhibitor of KinA sporulation pathway (predicted exonuclease)
MNYIIFDLEFNQGYNFTKGSKSITNSKCPFEIIQIGAVKLDDNLHTVSTLNRLIKPKIYTVINPFVKEITSITEESLEMAKPFYEIYKEFIEFIKEDVSILCVWGMSDMKELFRNVIFFQLDTSLVPKKYINIQRFTSKYLNCQVGTNIGLSKAVELFNIPSKNQFHDALNDAYYTSEVFKKIFNEEIKPEIYDLDKQIKQNRTTNKKQITDTTKLFKQFEKMFHREMSSEEKTIIKLAYMMGKTNQFQVEAPIDSKQRT